MEIIKNPLYALEQENEKLFLTIIKRTINYIEDIQYFDEQFFDSTNGRELYIKGRSPIEIYSYVVFWSIKNGCKAIYIEEFNLSRNFEIYREGQTYADSLPKWASYCKSKDSGILSILSPDTPDMRWSDEFVMENAKAFRLKEVPELLILTGSGSLLFYSILTAAAVISDVENVFIEKPTEGALLKIAGKIQSASTSEKTPGRIIGVLGDPNCGKSVFSRVLGCLIEELGEKNAWVYDCDASAPTSDWYIFGLQRAQNDFEKTEIKNARDTLKQKWTEDLEQKVADCMLNIKNHLEITVADFPGGLHKEAENIHKRIPDSGRAEMLKCCDSFIILGREDKAEIIAAWKAELKKYHPDGKIIAEILSKNPNDIPAVENAYFDDNKIFHALVHGLDRQNSRADIVEALQPSFQSFIKAI